MRNQVSLRRRVRCGCFLLIKSEAATNNHFENKVIRAACHPDAYPKVELPLRRDIEIDGRKDLMLLFALWTKTAQRPERSVIFKAAIDLFRDRIGDFEVGSELKATLSARSVESALDRIWSAPAERSDDGAFNRLYSQR